MAVPPPDMKEAYHSISRYCDYQDRCVQEVRLKLKHLGVSESDVTAFVDQLMEEDLINEERFALSYARGKFRIKNWGRIRIHSELKAKGIPPSVIKNALDTFSSDAYQQTLHDLALRKLKTLSSGTNQNRRKKLWDALIYRGWEKELVYDKIRELIP